MPDALPDGAFTPTAIDLHVDETLRIQHHRMVVASGERSSKKVMPYLLSNQLGRRKGSVGGYRAYINHILLTQSQCILKGNKDASH